MRLSSTILIGSFIFGSLAGTVGCSGQTQQLPTPMPPKAAPVTEEVTEPAAPEPAEEPTAAEREQEAAAAAEAKKKEEEAQRVAEVMARVEAAAAEENARWTPEMQKKAEALVRGKRRNVKAALKAILASPHRVPGNADRDVYRHPIQTLTFFGLRPDMTVVELSPGGGWYTEILAPLLANRGKLIATNYDPDGPADSMRTVYGKRFKLFLDKAPALFGKVETAHINPPDELVLGPAGSADLVIATRALHGTVRRGQLEAYLEAVHAVLEPGGVLGVVQHRALPDDEAAQSGDRGYLPEAWLIEQIEAAGFKLAAKSEINANPKDPRDHEKGVWTLPPSYALGDTDRAKYEAIGESDRMTLKFVKVAK